MRLSPVAVLVLIASACGPSDDAPDTSTGGDTGTDADVPDGGLPDSGSLPFDIAAPDIPWLDRGQPDVAPPVLTPCPDGYLETVIAGVTACEPWAPGDSIDCGPGEAHFTGAVCAPIGAACATGPFAADLPAGAAVVHVDPGASGGGDGSMARPFRNLTAAARRGLPADVVVALSQGTHTLDIVLPDGATLWGACAADTVVARTAPTGQPFVSIDGTGLTLRNLRLDGGGGLGPRVSGAGGSLTMTGVEISGAACQGVSVTGAATLSMTGVAVRDTASCPAAATLTPGGVVVEDGGTAAVHGSLIARNAAFSVHLRGATGATSLVLEDSVVRDTAETGDASLDAWVADGVLGAGIFAEDVSPDGSATVAVSVARSLLARHTGSNVVVRGAGVTADLDQVTSRDAGSLAATSRFSEIGSFHSMLGSSLSVRRSSVTGTLTEVFASAITSRLGGSMSLEDVVIAENKTGGLVASEGGMADVDRVVIANNRSSGLGATFGGVVSGRDVRISSLVGSGYVEDGLVTVGVGAGVLLLGGGQADLTRCIVEDHVEGIYVLFSSEATLEDVVVRRLGDSVGVGLLAVAESTITARGILVDRATASGIHSSSSMLQLEDAVVRDVVSQPGSEDGRGINIIGVGSVATLRRVEVMRHSDLGIFLFDDVSADLEDVRIVDTLQRGCVDTFGCVPHGHALGVYRGATLTADRFAIEGAPICGVHFALDASVDLMNGLVAGADIGACVQVDGYDLDRLSTGVIYRDNTRNLDSTSLPVPEATGF